MPWEHIEEGCALWNIKYNWCWDMDWTWEWKHQWRGPQMDNPGIQMDAMMLPGRGEEEMYTPMTTWQNLMNG